MKGAGRALQRAGSPRIRIAAIALFSLAGGCAFPYVDLGELPGGSGSDPGAAGGSAAGGSAAGGSAAGGTFSRGGGTTSFGGYAGHTGSGSPDYTAIDVAAGWYHGCALLSGGEVYCWGSNYGGQLGDGTTTTSQTPVRVLGLPDDAQHVDADYTDSCVQLSDGTLRCWGSNLYGQLGNGSSAFAVLSPVVALGYAVRELSLGEYHSCALLLDGSVQCWGYGQGALADGASTEAALTPVPVRGISSAVHVSSGTNFACALLADHSVSCWGANMTDDICGDENGVRPSAVPVTSLSDVVQIAAGGHACAVHSDGHVSCWGHNNFGQLGTPATPVPAECTLLSRPPIRVAGIDEVVQVAAGTDHTCALRANGDVYCWGLNRAGQLGDGTTDAHAEPTRVVGLPPAVKVSAGDTQTCALLVDGHISCWGAVGDAGVVDAPKPVPYELEF